MKISLVILAAVLMSGCCSRRQLRVETRKFDKNGCYFDGCNTCCKFSGGLACTLVACIKCEPGSTDPICAETGHDR